MCMSEAASGACMWLCKSTGVVCVTAVLPGVAEHMHQALHVPVWALRCVQTSGHCNIRAALIPAVHVPLCSHCCADVWLCLHGCS